MTGLKKFAACAAVLLCAAAMLISGCGKIKIGIKEGETTETRSFEGTAHVEDIDGVWTYVDENGDPDYTFSGIADNNNGSWLVENGVVNFDYSGPKFFDGRYYIIINGKNCS